MTKIYIVRHCETVGNALRLFQGATDLDITQTGEKQLKKLEERFNTIDIDAVYSSPLIRTVKTAKAIIGSRNISIQLEKGLIELNGGVIEGKPFEEIIKEFEGFEDIWFNHPEDFDMPGGEPMRTSYERIFETIINLAKNNPEKTIACATHGGIIRCLMCHIIYNDITRLKEVPIPINTSVSLLEIDDKNNIEIKFYNDYSHLSNDDFKDYFNE